MVDVVKEIMQLPEDERLQYALDVLNLLAGDDHAIQGYLMRSDTWSVSKTIDEGVDTPPGLTNEDITSAMAKLRTNLAL